RGRATAGLAALPRLLRGRGLRRLLLVRLLSQSGDGAFQLGLAGLLLFSPERAPTPLAVAGLLALVLLPYTLVGPLVGTLLDRWWRRSVLVGAGAVRAVAVLATAGVVLAGPAVSDALLVPAVLVVLSVNRLVLAALGAGLPAVVAGRDLVLASAVVPTVGTLALALGAGAGTAVRLGAGGARADGLVLVLAAALVAAQARLEEAEAAHQEEQLERALAEQARLDAEQRLRELQRRVLRSGVEIDAWSTAPADEDEAVPATTAELLERLAAGRLARVVFTGDPARALELDDVVHTGLHVQRTWEALLALRDYAAAKADGSVDSDVQGYLERTPDGMCSWPAGRHARGESSTVQNDPRLRAPRLLPVPVEVDPSGRAPMWAHMKLLSLGQTSPRLHYLDDTRRSGRVYVGYVGRHLPNTQTS
ncbi:hypothetical protein HLB09_15720, partial [Pseudokineococcus marinus]|nr:hypothetical protein [Pseudokineococcus marinus]